MDMEELLNARFLVVVEEFHDLGVYDLTPCDKLLIREYLRHKVPQEPFGFATEKLVEEVNEEYRFTDNIRKKPPGYWLWRSQLPA